MEKDTIASLIWNIVSLDSSAARKEKQAHPVMRKVFRITGLSWTGVSGCTVVVVKDIKAIIEIGRLKRGRMEIGNVFLRCKNNCLTCCPKVWELSKLWRKRPSFVDRIIKPAIPVNATWVIQSRLIVEKLNFALATSVSSLYRSWIINWVILLDKESCAVME